MTLALEGSAATDAPGPHFPPGADTNHFFGRCDECDAHYLALITLGEVEDAYWDGRVSQIKWEAYMHAWATGAVRYSSAVAGWTDTPWDPEVLAFVQRLRDAYAARAQ